MYGGCCKVPFGLLCILTLIFIHICKHNTVALRHKWRPDHRKLNIVSIVIKQCERQAHLPRNTLKLSHNQPLHTEVATCNGKHRHIHHSQSLASGYSHLLIATGDPQVPYNEHAAGEVGGLDGTGKVLGGHFG